MYFSLSHAVAHRISMLCFERGKTIYEISENTGIAKSTLSNMITAKYDKVNLNKIFKICNCFNIDLVEFFDHSYFREIVE